jgi:hypothetical protein
VDGQEVVQRRLESSERTFAVRIKYSYISLMPTATAHFSFFQAVDVVRGQSFLKTGIHILIVRVRDAKMGEQHVFLYRLQVVKTQS